MQLKASTDYGLRAILYLASKKTTCSSRDIAQDMAVPRDYLIQIAQQLRNAGLISARPGKNGGYRLAKDPNDITLLEVIEALKEDNRPERDGAFTDADQLPSVTQIKRAYDLVLKSYDVYLDSITVETILQCTENGTECNAILAKSLSEESQRLIGQEKNPTESKGRKRAKEGHSLPEESTQTRISVGMSEESRQLLRDQRVAIYRS